MNHWSQLTLTRRATPEDTQGGETPEGAETEGGASPTPEDEETGLPDDPTEALEEMAATDSEQVVEDLEGQWVPQLSSKQDGMEIDGEVWDDADILEDHLELREDHPRVRLVWSGDFGSFREGDYWVTIAGIGYSDPDQALSWCRSNGLGPDDCYAKQLNSGGGHEGTTRLQ